MAVARVSFAGAFAGAERQESTFPFCLFPALKEVVLEDEDSRLGNGYGIGGIENGHKKKRSLLPVAGAMISVFKAYAGRLFVAGILFQLSSVLGYLLGRIWEYHHVILIGVL